MGFIKYKINVLAALREAGYTSTRIRREHLLAESTLQKIRKGDIVAHTNIAQICELLDLQPGDILEFVKEE